MEDQTKHYLISGLVQGVGFRRFVERAAHGLKLRGWVRNLSDGRVEAWVQGPKADLTEFEMQIRRGPPSAKVESLLATDVKEETLRGFLVKEDGEKPWSDG